MNGLRNISCFQSGKQRAYAHKKHVRSNTPGDTGGTVTVVPANAFTFNINSNNKNKSIKADFI